MGSRRIVVLGGSGFVGSALVARLAARGETVVVPRSSVGIAKSPGTSMAEVQGSTSLSEVVSGLNALGVAPHDMIDILKSINAAGALHAEFIVQ